MLSWNVNGLSRKIHDLDFINLIKQYDIILLQETWLHKDICLNLDITGYKSYHLFGNKSVNTTKGRFSGGISLYYKDHLHSKLNIVKTAQAGIYVDTNVQRFV